MWVGRQAGKLGRPLMAEAAVDVVKENEDVIMIAAFCPRCNEKYPDE